MRTSSLAEKDVAYAAIDAGADAILGDLVHILKGFATYRGKPILYGLCNFVANLHRGRNMRQSRVSGRFKNCIGSGDPISKVLTTFCSNHSDLRRDVIKGGLVRVSFLPTYVYKLSRPELLQSPDDRLSEVAEYLSEIARSEDLKGRFEQYADELVISFDR